MTTLVLLPGLAGDAQMWQSQLEALAYWHPVVTDVHARHATMAQMASALLSEHAGDLVLCGASMGGMLAMEAVRQAPDRVAGLALLGTSAHPETPEMRQLREAAIIVFEQGHLAEVIEPNVEMAFHPDHARDKTLVDAYLEFVYRAGASQLVAQNRAVIARPDARLHLPQVRCSTLVMCGDTDRLAPRVYSQEIAALVPGAQLVIVPHCGHMLTMEQPAFVNAALAQWLESLPL
ncbi:MAG: alpha/beta fold hydrolase [Pseudomonadota bacterium]